MSRGLHPTQPWSCLLSRGLRGLQLRGAELTLSHLMQAAHLMQLVRGELVMEEHVQGGKRYHWSQAWGRGRGRQWGARGWERAKGTWRGVRGCLTEP